METVLKAPPFSKLKGMESHEDAPPRRTTHLACKQVLLVTRVLRNLYLGASTTIRAEVLQTSPLAASLGADPNLTRHSDGVAEHDENTRPIPIIVPSGESRSPYGASTALFPPQ